MFCTKCGNQLEEGVRFCVRCGAPVAGVPVSDMPVAGAPTPAADASMLAGATVVIPTADQMPAAATVAIPAAADQTSVIQPASTQAGETQVLSDRFAGFDTAVYGNDQPDAEAFTAGLTGTQSFEPRPLGTQPGFDAPVPSRTEPPVYVVPPSGAQAAGSTSGKGKKGLIIGIIVAAVVVAVALVVLFVYPGFLKGDGSSAAAPESAEQSEPIEAAEPAAEEPEADGQDTQQAASNDSFDAAKAEDEAREAALDAEKQVFTGTIVLTSLYDRAKEVSPSLANDFKASTEEIAILELDGATSIEGRSSGDMGALVRRSGGESLYMVDSGQFKQFAGEKITVAVHAADLWYPSDVTGALYTVSARNVTVIAPLTEDTAEDAIREAGTLSQETRDAIEEIAALEKRSERSDDDFVIADSDTRRYSRSELEKYDNYELYLARNEIYARYGRMFKNKDLQTYFNSKGWYEGTIAPEDFTNNMLNDIERDNAELMLDIEKDRDSPYLS